LTNSFKYKAVDTSGRIVEYTQSANSKEELIHMLREKGFTPIKIQAEEQSSKDLGEMSLFAQKVKLKDIAVFCKQLYTMLNAGMALSAALDTLGNQTENKTLKKAIKEVYSDLQTGLQLSQAMKKHTKVFPVLLITMIEAGEMTGNLDNVLERMSTHYEKENKINSKIKGAMIYPIILSIVAVGAIIFMLVGVMPTFTDMFASSGVDLPAPTKLLMNMSETIKNYWYIFIAVIAVIAVIFKRYTATITGKKQYDTLKLKLPVIGSSVTNIATSRFTRTLSTLMASGIAIVPAMEASAGVTDNQVVIDGIAKVTEDIKKGLSISLLLKSMNFFPPMVISMISIGEESGSLEDMLSKTADYYDEELEATIQKMLSMLEPMLILFMGVVIGFIVVSMMLPISDLASTV
jgi:general secretory pathway component, cryptic